MPDSLPLSTAREKRVHAHPIEKHGEFKSVSANVRAALDNPLEAPPRDVLRLLGRYDTELPYYFDAQLHAQRSGLAQRWPHLLGNATHGPGPAPRALACE